MCSMNIATFRKYFIRHTGFLPLEYLNSYRLKVAPAWLKNSQEQIVQIALESGFPALSHFNRVFKAEFGAAPGEYRQDIRKVDKCS